MISQKTRDKLDSKSEAQKGNITPEMEIVAKQENIDVNKLARLIDLGKVVIPKTLMDTQNHVVLGKVLKLKSMQILVHLQKLMILN